MAARLSSRRLFEVFVARVPWTASANEIREHFAQFGPVKKCLLPFDKETGFHKGFCWVGFSTEEGLKNALQKDSHILEGVKWGVAAASLSLPTHAVIQEKLDVKHQRSRVLQFLGEHSDRRTTDIS